jgi:hypothetical protein
MVDAQVDISKAADVAGFEPVDLDRLTQCL